MFTGHCATERAWADALPVFGERRSLQYSHRPYTDQRTIPLLGGYSRGQFQPLFPKVTNNCSNDTLATKRIENIIEPLTNLSIRIQRPAAVRGLHVAHRQGKVQHPFPSFIPTTLV